MISDRCREKKKKKRSERKEKRKGKKKNIKIKNKKSNKLKTVGGWCLLCCGSAVTRVLRGGLAEKLTLRC